MQRWPDKNWQRSECLIKLIEQAKLEANTQSAVNSAYTEVSSQGIFTRLTGIIILVMYIQAWMIHWLHALVALCYLLLGSRSKADHSKVLYIYCNVNKAA